MSIVIDVPVPVSRPPRKPVRCGVCDRVVSRTAWKCQECVQPMCTDHAHRQAPVRGQAPRYLCTVCCTPAGGA